MVYKKYIRKNGKLHGPYYYESYRDGEKIKKRYLGTSPGDTAGSRSIWVTLQIFLVIALLLAQGNNT